ncbi:MAG: YjgP/YjgQ family permease [Spirochaetales bacterium]|nr:YjgP/YjgQ family permease [Spirochaetales bacterium]
MRILTRYLLAQFLFVSLIALLFFVMSLCLADLLMNLSRFGSNATMTFSKIVWLTVLYIPQTISFALAPSLLFAVSFVLGSMYSNNELITVFSSGIPLVRLALPLFIVGALASLFLFFWNDQGVIPTMKEKNSLTRQAEGLSNLSNTNVAILTDKGKILMSAAFYDDSSKRLSEVILVFRHQDGSLERRVDAQWGNWVGKTWVFHKVRLFEIDRQGNITQTTLDEWKSPRITEPPESFQRKVIKVTEMTFHQAGVYVESLKRGGLPYRAIETDYFQRVSFSLGPFVVIWISAAIGGRFRKNILLMSLLTSLLVSSSYIVLQMIFGLFSKTGFLPPLLGASSGVAIGAFAGFYLFAKART